MKKSMNKTKPVVGITSDVRRLGEGNFHVTGEKYINAVINGLQALPYILPVMTDGDDLSISDGCFHFDDFLPVVDGILLTGSISNVDASRYGEANQNASLPTDQRRDDFNLKLINWCLQNKVPMLGICRGFQEINVAFGGSLHQEIHKVEGFSDHRVNLNQDESKYYDLKHTISITKDGVLQQLHKEPSAKVNSLHGQGIKTLGKGLKVEAMAEDNIIEAISVESADSFALAVQWHPESHFNNIPLYKNIFAGFSQAVYDYQQRR